MTKYLIAGHVVAMEHASPEAERALDAYRYRGELAPEHVFSVTPEALRAAGEEWLKGYQGEIEEYLLSRAFCLWLAPRGGMYLHASAVAMDGFAYAFTAAPGTGKSTHAHLWRQAFGERAEILNDDKPLIVQRDGAFYVCGSPWSGKEGIRSRREVPLAAVCFLRQGRENAICRADTETAVAPLLAQTLLPEEPREMDALLTLVDHLVRTIPLYRMECMISEDAARLAYGAMRPDQKDVPT